MNLIAGSVLVLSLLVSPIAFSAGIKTAEIPASDARNDGSKPLELPDFTLIQQAQAKKGQPDKFSYSCESAEGVTFMQNDVGFEQCVSEGQLRQNTRGANKALESDRQVR